MAPFAACTRRGPLYLHPARVIRSRPLPRCSRLISLPSAPRSRVGEILDPVLHIIRVENSGNQLQIADGLADGNTELVSVHHPSESRGCLQTPMRDCQQILVLAEKDAAK
jgi:hypothetical protein